MEKPNFKYFEKAWWEKHKALGQTELGQNGQFDELPFIEYEEKYGPIPEYLI